MFWYPFGWISTDDWTVQRDGAQSDNYCSSLIKQTTSRDLFYVLSHYIIALFLSLIFFLHLPLSLLTFISLGFFFLPVAFLPFFPALHPRSYLIAICHLQSALFKYPQFPVSQTAGREDKEKERRWEEKWSTIHQELKRKRKHFPPMFLEASKMIQVEL